MALVAVAAVPSLSAAPVITELMYHPLSVLNSPEDPAREWIEIHNPGAAAVDLSGWKLTRGVSFTIPAGTTVAAGGYVVIAADLAKFAASYPGFAGTVIGGWTGKLANGGERVELSDAAGVAVDDVNYADEGAWALRVRSAVSFGHQGWEWEAKHDGGGHSLAKVVAASPSLEGQNWKVSDQAGGTPGAANWTTVPAGAGLFAVDVRHAPVLPKSNEAIRVHATLPTGREGSAAVHWRVAGAAGWQQAGFVADGPTGAAQWPGVATIPPQANGTILEYYVDPDAGNPDAVNDTVPRKARTSNPGAGTETFGNVCNYLLRVDDSYDPARDFTVPANQPLLRFVMTPADQAELTQLQTTSGQEDSTATFNCAFISQDGTGVKVVQNAGVRNRGFSSALGPPNNFHISFRSDDPWKGRNAMQLNCQYGYSQVLGKVLFAQAGVASHDAVIVQLRVNGTDLAETGGRMYGRYALLEGRGGDWASNHYPDDPDGNFYRADDHEPGPVGTPPGNLGSGEFQYEGTNHASYSDTFYKETNQEANDYSDLVELTKIVSAPVTGGTAEQPAISNADYPAAVATVLDLDQFYRYIACDALLGNQEGGLQSGRADDFSLYRGVVDKRFRFVPHDLDDIFDIGAGVGNPITRSLFSYDEQVQNGNTGVVGLRRLFNHPALVPKYYAAVLDAMDRWFNRATVDPVIDRLFTGWVPATDGSAATPNRGIQEIKGYIDARRANVLSQIPQTYSLNVSGNAPDSIEGYKVTTTGAANFTGTFHVARTWSITVNGVLAQWFYRTAGSDAAGTWRLAVPAGGGSVLRPGLNKVVVRFWDGINGTGNVVEEYVSNVSWLAAGGTTVSGTLTSPGSLGMLAPDSYIPGIPMLVRVDLRDAQGNLNRRAWNSTVNLAASNGVTVSPSTLSLTNGMGSALVTVGGGAVTTRDLFVYGTGGNGTLGSGTPGSEWKHLSDFNVTTLSAFIASSGTTWMTNSFDDSAWTTVRTQAGYGDGDENTPIPDRDYNPSQTGSQNVPCYLFRSRFTIDDVSKVTAVTGQVKYDDGYRLYVNGVKVSNSAGIGDSLALNQYATAAGENTTANFSVPLDLLRNGENVVAVQIHQDDATSSDITFDVRMSATVSTGAADPGPFTLTASVGSLSAGKALTSLGAAAGTAVSGTLPAGVSEWSGVVRVTGDVTVPAGATLSIAPGTHILMTGTSGAGSTTGADLISTGGEINALGTAAQPISITANDPTTRWGEINVGGSTSVWRHCLVSLACHSPGGGHTGTGPCFRLTNGANWTFEDGVVADLVGKTLTNSGNVSMTMRRSQFARCVMGPETDGSAILIEDSNFSEMLASYRESGGPDDEDNIYIHDSGGRPVVLRGSVFSNCGDDAIDLLAGSLTIEDCIVRNAFDKGISLLNNDITVRRTQIIDCDICVSTKCQTGSAETRPFLNVFENCTIVAENHPTNTSDGTFHSVGVHTRNKYGTTTMNITVDLRNCIVSAEEPIANDYGSGSFPLNVQNYCCFFDQGGTNPANPLPSSGTGNLITNPGFSNAANRDFTLATGSPCINAGDPALQDSDGSRRDLGALPTGGTGGTTAGEIHWTLAGAPYRVTANTTVPAGTTLRIDPGVNVQFDQNVRMIVNGRMIANGSAGSRIVFSHVPGTNLSSDVDPIKLGTQTGAPKWGGLRMYDSMAQENVFRFCDFVNAQGTSPSGSENYGSLGFIRSWGWVDHCTFAGTHLRMCYGRNSKLTVTYTDFPDMFIFDPVLNRIEEPTTDFIAAADNSMEPCKVEYPTSDAEVSGANAANFPNGMPLNGYWRVYFNSFHGNRGHQDVFDCDSGRWSPRDPVTNFQTNGQFVIDCRYNHFYGLAGDEHMDLGGDAYIASNVFENARKDYWTNDTGYSNAISSGDKGSGTTIMLARNVCYDLDHVINCKLNTATIFEHNTVADIHPDFLFQGETVTQQVVCAPINFFIPQDGTNPSYGDGAYMGFNIVSNVPHMFSGPDARKVNNVVVNDVTTKIEFFHNLLDRIADPVIGPNHPGGFFSGTYGPNQSGAPGFVNPAAEDYALRTDSLARGTAPGGISYGAEIPEWAYVLGGPSGTVADTAASFTVGGPGIVAFRWRLDGGAWSAPVQIGAGGLFPRGTTATVRQATLALSGLGNGVHTLEVLGQDMAGNWQGSDPARLYDGLPQATATVRTWTVQADLPVIAISEIHGDTGSATPTLPVQWVELVNRTGAAVDLTGWSLSDNAATPGEQAIAGSAAAGAPVMVTLTGFRIDNDGDAIYLFDAAGTLRDSVVFGPLPAGHSLARVGAPAAWTLCDPTYGLVPNTASRMSDSSQIVINEWLAAGGIRYREDWVELANLVPFPASLSGMVLTDARFGTAPAFPPLSFIGGHGYVKLLADGDSTAGPSHTSFKIDGLTAELLLYGSGGRLQDVVRTFPQVTDVSQGRVESGGTGGFAFFVLPTAGAANGSSDPGYANAGNVLNHLRITEIMYNPAGGSDFEFIELVNNGGTALDLGGVRFVQGIGFEFPSGSSLAPGAEVVLVRDAAAFASRYGSGLNVAGSFSGSLDNSGETLTLRLPSPWDANVLSFRYEASWQNTNGSGYSLEVVSSGISIADYGSYPSWKASAQLYGTPDGWILSPGSLPAWLAEHGFTPADLYDDADADGLENAMEFAMGTNPHSAAAPHGADRLPVAARSPEGRVAMSFELAATGQPGGYGAEGVSYEIVSGSDLNGWTTVARKASAAAGWTDGGGTGLPPGSLAVVPGADGRVRVIFEDPAPASVRRFLRLRAVLP